MRICIAYENLFPARTRVGQRIEALARKFRARGHDVIVVTRPSPDSDPDAGVPVVRVAAGDGDRGAVPPALRALFQRDSVDVVYAESLTSLTDTVTRAAVYHRVPAVVRVLADSAGIVHALGGSRASRDDVRRRVSRVLRSAATVLVATEQGREMLGVLCDVPATVLPESIDVDAILGRSSDAAAVERFRTAHGLAAGRTLAWIRDRVARDCCVALAPFLRELHGRLPDIRFVAGSTDPGAAAPDLPADVPPGVVVRPGFGGADAGTALRVADIVLVPPGSRVLDGEVLEIMLSGAVVACFQRTARGLDLPAASDGTAVVLSEDDPAGSAERIAALLTDDAAMAAIRARAREHAASRGIDGMVAALEAVLSGVVPADGEAERRPPRDEAGGAAIRGAGEVSDGFRETPVGPRKGREERDRDEGRSAKDAEGPVDFDDVEEVPGFEDAPPEDEDGGDGAGPIDTVDGSDEDPESGPAPEEPGRGRPSRAPGAPAEGDARGAEGESADVAAARAGVAVETAPDATERPFRQFESMLTLKDLMPFLRPPKHVLVLGASSGGGQARVAHAIVEAFKSIDRNLRVRQSELFDHVDRNAKPAFLRNALTEWSAHPGLFGPLFPTLDEPLADPPVPDLDAAVESALAPKLREFLEDRKPDCVVATHFLPLRILSAMKAAGTLRASFAVVVTDFDAHPAWKAEGASHYFVANDRVRHKLVKLGVPAQDITITGLPVHPTFGAEVNREAVRRNLGLRGPHPVILVRPGGLGTTEQTLEMLRQVSDVGSPMNVIVLAGKNDALREAVEKEPPGRHAALRAFGFVNNIHEMMAVADLLVTRAGGHTLAEALASALPMLLLRPAPGLDSRNADVLIGSGVAVRADGPADLEYELRELMRNRRRLRDMREAALAVRRPGAAQAVADRVARIAR